MAAVGDRQRVQLCRDPLQSVACALSGAVLLSLPGTVAMIPSHRMHLVDANSRGRVRQQRQNGHGIFIVAMVALYIPRFLDGSERTANGRPWELLWSTHLWRLSTNFLGYDHSSLVVDMATTMAHGPTGWLVFVIPIFAVQTHDRARAGTRRYEEVHLRVPSARDHHPLAPCDLRRQLGDSIPEYRCSPYVLVVNMICLGMARQ